MLDLKIGDEVYIHGFVDEVHGGIVIIKNKLGYFGTVTEEIIPSAQPERILYAKMSDAEFEKWLYEHGICNPNIHESIPCDAVPLLIDNAISELPTAQPEIIRCKDCKNWHTNCLPVCEKHGCDVISDFTKPDDFCSWAERITE